jgi:hypothetical protein
VVVLVWCAVVVWCGVVWCGVVRCGEVRVLPFNCCSAVVEVAFACQMRDGGHVVL